MSGPGQRMKLKQTQSHNGIKLSSTDTVLPSPRPFLLRPRGFLLPCIICKATIRLLTKIHLRSDANAKFIPAASLHFYAPCAKRQIYRAVHSKPACSASVAVAGAYCIRAHASGSRRPCVALPGTTCCLKPLDGLLLVGRRRGVHGLRRGRPAHGHSGALLHTACWHCQ